MNFYKNGNHKHMVFGIALLAVQTYFLIRILNSNFSIFEYSEFSAMWSLTMGVILGFTFPLEGYGLALKNRNLKQNQKENLEVVTFQKIVLVLFITLTFGSFFFTKYAFDGNWTFYPNLILLAISFAFIFIVRAELIRNQKFIQFSVFINLEGLFRLVFVLSLINLGFNTGIAAASAITLASLITAIFGSKITKIDFKRFFSRVKFVRTNIHSLVLASLSTYLILNIGPFLIQIFDPSSGLAGLELNAVTIARSPLFIGPVIQSILIKNIQFSLSSENNADAKRLLNKTMLVTGIFYLFGVIAFTLLGNSIVEVLYGPESTSDQTNFGILALATMFSLLSLTAQSFFVAKNDLIVIRNAWLISLFILFLTISIPLANVVIRTEIASFFAFFGSFIYLALAANTKRIKQPR